MLSRQTFLLKPMQTGASGYARVQAENGRTRIQLHARGIPAQKARLFGYLEGGAACELGSAVVNENGEASLDAEAEEAPERIRGLMLLAQPPKPLLIGACGPQLAGDLLDLKNAALALCERLKPRPKAAAQVAAQAAPARTQPVKSPRTAEALPREIFLPAIDPAPYLRAKERREAEVRRKPVNRLRALVWPGSFAPLRAYFAARMPVRLFPAPGWRFVSAAEGLWLGRQALDGRVRRVAYIYAGDAPPEVAGRCQTLVGPDEKVYQVLIQVV